MDNFQNDAKIALMVLKAYTGFSDRQLVEHLNGNIHYQIFCGIMIPPSLPITIVTNIETSVKETFVFLMQEKKEESFKGKNA